MIDPLLNHHQLLSRSKARRVWIYPLIMDRLIGSIWSLFTTTWGISMGSHRSSEKISWLPGKIYHQYDFLWREPAADEFLGRCREGAELCHLAARIPAVDWEQFLLTLAWLMMGTKTRELQLQPNIWAWLIDCVWFILRELQLFDGKLPALVTKTSGLGVQFAAAGCSPISGGHGMINPGLTEICLLIAGRKQAWMAQFDPWLLVHLGATAILLA